MTHNPHLNYRPDIDGLRAFAILLVIIFHAYPRFLRGGFIGVDIFFVISGYLITGIILKGLTQGNFSLLEFYSRRIKRIFPALLVVLISCLISGWFILLSDEYQLLGKHISAGAIYISNFILESEAGYFDTSAELKPLLHLWSLSIEEQFYLIFPLLLILAFRLGLNPISIILACLISSFLLNINQIENNPDKVFFHPQTRAWELLIGSSVAYINLYFRPTFDKIAHHLLIHQPIDKEKSFANILSWVGFVLIITAWISFNIKNILFPSGWALMPSIGAACIILAGEKAWFNRCILANKTAIFIGLISYPLYLWHWPILSYLQIIEMEKPSSSLRFFALLLSCIFAWGTYQFIEKKFRYRNHWIIPTGLLISLFLIGLIGFQVYQKQGYPERLPVYSNWNAGEVGLIPWEKNNLVIQQPCLDKYGAYVFCLQQNSNKPATAMLIGDSHANHLYPGLISKPSLTGGNLFNFGVSSCLPFFNNPDKECTPLINKALEMAIETPTVKTVILSSYSGSYVLKQLTEKKTNQQDLWNQLTPFIKKAPKKDIAKIFQSTMRETFQRLLNANKNVIFVIDIPALDFRPSACSQRPWRISGQASKKPCATQRSLIDSKHKKYRDLAFQVLQEFPTIKVWDTIKAFCDQNYCWAIKNDQMLYRDDNHLNETGSLYLTNYFHLQ